MNATTYTHTHTRVEHKHELRGRPYDPFSNALVTSPYSLISSALIPSFAPFLSQIYRSPAFNTAIHKLPFVNQFIFLKEKFLTEILLHI